MKQLSLIACGLTLLCACGGSKTETSEQDLMNQVKEAPQPVVVSRELLDEMMQTLPSPIETANLINKSKAEFKKELLIPAGNSSMFADKYQQATALGGYGVDLGYLNLQNKTLYVVEYLESLRNLAKDLKVEQFFDFVTLSNLAKNRNNVDSLIHISTENFNQIDEYLRTQKRGDLSVLILVGSWIEGMYMFDAIAAEHPSTEMTNRIGEQKIILDNIYAILSKIENIDHYKELKTQLGGLKSVYDNVKISYIYHEPKMKEVNGQLVVEDNTETVIEITPEQLAAISKEIKTLRNKTFFK